MSDTAAFLVDRVFPLAPVRMWVISFPPPLRYLLAYDAEICNAVIGIFLSEVFSWLRRTAKRELGLRRLSEAHPGAVTFLQRFGDGLRLSVHLHSLVLDGVYVHAGANHPPTFHALPAPTKLDIQAVGTNVWLRTTRLLQERGKYFDADPAEADTLAREQPLLAAAYAASVNNVIAFGPRAGQGVLRLGWATNDDREPGPDEDPPADEVTGPVHGFNVHAGVRVSASDRKRLERLQRYAARGPLASERLSRAADGDVVYRLRRKWRDGTTSLRFSPYELIEKLCVLVPPPRFNLTRFHGVLAPNHRLRALVVPSPHADANPTPQQLRLFTANGLPSRTPRRRDGKPRAEPRPRMPWALLLKRTFGVDVLVCERCGHSPLKLRAIATQPADARALLRSLGAPCDEVPPSRLPRAPPAARPFGAWGPWGQLSLFASAAPPCS